MTYSLPSVRQKGLAQRIRPTRRYKVKQYSSRSSNQDELIRVKADLAKNNNNHRNLAAFNRVQ